MTYEPPSIRKLTTAQEQAFGATCAPNGNKNVGLCVDGKMASAGCTGGNQAMMTSCGSGKFASSGCNSGKMPQ
jgi:hypothetical protein